jgi:hypothetical protein
MDKKTEDVKRSVKDKPKIPEIIDAKIVKPMKAS